MSNHKCPKCGSKRSFILFRATTLMYATPFTDENGKLHHHDSNRTTEQRQCSDCHELYAVGRHASCWCGWKQNETVNVPEERMKETLE